jgi:hypothetical protein
MNRGWWGSWRIYSMDYLCTKLEIPLTTLSITAVKLSNKNPQDTCSLSESIHGILST